MLSTQGAQQEQENKHEHAASEIIETVEPRKRRGRPKGSKSKSKAIPIHEPHTGNVTPTAIPANVPTFSAPIEENGTRWSVNLLFNFDFQDMK